MEVLTVSTLQNRKSPKKELGRGIPGDLYIGHRHLDLLVVGMWRC